jgi:signal transduction histidine kinase
MVDNGVVSLTIHDNGIGFDPQTISFGIGLENIRTRISAYNGKMTILSSPDNGTEVSIEIEQS